MKLLGVTFDEHLKFTSHLDELSKRISRKTGVLMRLQNLIPTLAKLRILIQIVYFATIINLLSDGMARNSVFIPQEGYLLLQESGGKLHLNCR